MLNLNKLQGDTESLNYGHTSLNSSTYPLTKVGPNFILYFTEVVLWPSDLL